MPNYPSGIEQHHIDTFNSHMLFALQQKESRLEGAVSVATLRGAKERFQYVGKKEMEDIKTRNEKTKWTEDDFYNRWVSAIPSSAASIVDKRDIPRVLIDPSSSLIVSHAMGANRKKDLRIANAFNAVAYSGKQAEEAIEFPATQIIPAKFSGEGKEVGMTIAKLRRSSTMLNRKEVDAAQRFCAITAYQLEELLATTEITNQLYNDVRALVKGDVDSFMGFKFIRIELLPFAVATKLRNCFCWQKESMKFGLMTDIHTEVNKLPDYHSNIGIETFLDCGAVRLYDEGVVQVDCKEDESALSLDQLVEQNEKKLKKV